MFYECFSTLLDVYMIYCTGLLGYRMTADSLGAVAI